MDRLTIDSIQECKDHFLQQFATSNQITCELSENTEIDVAGIQLLVSVFKKCREEKRGFVITGPVSLNVRDRLFLMGLAKTDTVDGERLMQQLELLIGK